MSVKRRDFIRSAGAALLSVVSSRVIRGSNADHLERLACNSWPFRGYFDTPEMHQFRDPKDPLITQSQFPEFLADHFKIHNVEFLLPHFVDTDPGTIGKVKAGLKKAHSRCSNLMAPGFSGGVFSLTADRQAIAKEAARWGDVAVALGCPTITVALTGEGRVDAHIAATNLAPAVNAIHKHGIKLLFHNDDLQH